MSNPRERKTIDVWRILVNYGQGWEHETTELSFREARANARAYREAAPQYPVRLRSGRDRKEATTCA
tara:strand:- start:371 stop:571 length:201 start_codon:yes stop_codon:yes gene_type:complete